MTVLAWATPTRRAMRWPPLLGSAAGVAAVVVAMSAAGAPPAPEQAEMIAVAILVAAAALALDDPAHALVAAAPVGFARRLGHRLAWLGPATLGLLFGIGWIAHRLGVAPVSAHLLTRAAALGSVAIAAHVLVSRMRPDLSTSATTVAPAAWVTFGVATSRDTWGGTITHLWLDRPWALVGGAAVVVAVGSRRN